MDKTKYVIYLNDMNGLNLTNLASSEATSKLGYNALHNQCNIYNLYVMNHSGTSPLYMKNPNEKKNIYEMFDSRMVGFIALDKKNPNNDVLSKKILEVLKSHYDILFDDNYCMNFQYDDTYQGYGQHLEDIYDANEDKLVDFLSMKDKFSLEDFETKIKEINTLPDMGIKAKELNQYYQELGLNDKQIKHANSLMNDVYNDFVVQSYQDALDDTWDQLEDHSFEVSNEIKDLIKQNNKALSENEL